MRQKLNNNLEEAKEIFLTNVREKSCPTSMFWLGEIAEKEGNYEMALSWYVGSFCTHLLQGKSFEEITEPKLNPWKALNSLNCKLPPQAQNFLQEIILPDHSKLSQSTYASFPVKPISAMLVNAHAHYCPDEDLSAYTVELAKWDSKRTSLFLQHLGKHFSRWGAMDKAGYCFYLSKSGPSQCILAQLIDKHYVNYDEEGRFFKEEDRHLR